MGAGAIIEQIQPKFDIVAAEAVKLSPGRAEQFHAVYKGVVAPALFAAMVQELASGEACSDCCAVRFTQCTSAVHRRRRLCTSFFRLSSASSGAMQWQLPARHLTTLCLHASCE